MRYYTFTVIICLCFIVACSMGNSKQLHENLPRMKAVNKVGILVRIPASSPVEYTRYVKTLQAMLAGYKQIKEIVIVDSDTAAITTFQSNDDRFYQTSLDGDFLYYKATGIVTSYCTKNKAELQQIFEKGIDLLAIYEPYGVVSYGMGFVDYDSVFVIIDKNLKVVYFDYNHDRKNTNEFSTQVLWDFLLNEMNTRCVRTLMKIGFLD